MSQSSHLSRYRPAVLAITSIAAATCVYALYSACSEPPARDIGLRRSNAVHRQSRERRDPDLSILGSAGPDADHPLGSVLVTVGLEHRMLDIASEGMPSDANFRERFGVDITATFRRQLSITIARCFYEACWLAKDEEARDRLRRLAPEIDRLFTTFAGVDIGTIRDQAPGIAHAVLGADEGHCRSAIDHFLVAPPFTEIISDDSDDDQVAAETEDGNSFTASDPEPSQGLKGLLYHIAEAEAKRKAYEHRGVHCDGCHETPIRGVRWRCLNCADYDLCSTCEQTVPHFPNHVFAKVKIPLPTMSRGSRPQANWYPGYADSSHYAYLKSSVKKRLEEEYEFDSTKLDALYDQFTTLCNVGFPGDPAHIDRAIDCNAFRRALTSERWQPRFRQNILYDRMFAFYDTDKNDLIGFEEFVSGVAYIRGPKRFPSLDRALQGFDTDGDGYVDRYDFIRMFHAKHDIQKLLLTDMMEAQEEERTMNAVEDLRSSQPISAMFRDEDIPQGEVRTATGKTRDRHGDMQPLPGAKTILEDDEGWPDDEQRRRATNTARRPPHERMQGHLSRFEEILSQTDGQQDAVGSNGLVVAHDESNAAMENFPPTNGSATGSCPPPTAAEDEPLDKDVLWQIVEDGFHEMLDPLFLAPETVDGQVVATREERQKWAKQVEEAAADLERMDQELESGAEIDPLVATAKGALDRFGGADKTVKEEMVPTDADSLSKLEEEISQKPLEELLQTSGYELLDGAGPEGEDQGASAASTGHEPADSTMPQNRPNGSADTKVVGDSPRQTSNTAQPDDPDAGAAHTVEKPPSAARLRLLTRHARLDQEIEARGGVGRQRLGEIEHAIEDTDLGGLVTSWLELASF
ncbi:uncharacterized protein LTR77_003562 [Saxophila tyrrhenica]|uniref:Uncharacterized protein n=1 Tax=Saxophila tyrrhenica TaxID=1690608 RepID=A0AAV9PEQ1_9PEZI|nr:hypothetical protein LTR77_003562 [Saxophila tyrrhenica]